MRLFVAVNLSETVRDAIADAIASFPVTDPPWRWVSRDNWHITLKFLGDVDDVRTPDVAAALAIAARDRPPFRLALTDFGAFPGIRRPRVLFYNASEGGEELAGLATAVDAALLPLGFVTEDRPFHPHATVARVKRPLPRGITHKLESAGPLAGAVQEVASFELMASQLGRTGARYRAVARIALSG
jgi:2'-5' RNA ligase